ncbi:hypothetical protein BU24DRAFT_2868 [Aaosphaeria arxii CBS 175.79]|uniref:Uncharacterized protein n=1 Tax=Aaosphaeria arxii CBS 175.79 TaxID=1450172 RepID=A0A6A5Y4S1_9PLEO|nr:uncharacterized protein BU24DRAFT_2868 [Aaosphaeria arxii CBS 175.79]KAF2020552.1 hypothetical protein BU24DRAFT_2868 [Aaosphaeria arxii CBS 175.79]
MSTAVPSQVLLQGLERLFTGYNTLLNRHFWYRTYLKLAGGQPDVPTLRTTLSHPRHQIWRHCSRVVLPHYIYLDEVCPSWRAERVNTIHQIFEIPSHTSPPKSAQPQAKFQPWKAFIKIGETSIAKNSPTSAEGSEVRILAELDDKDLGG